MKHAHSLRPHTLSPRNFIVEILESRIVPSALNITTAETATTLIKAGDTGDAGGTTIVGVSSGSALVFVTDLNGNGAYDSGELTGIALANNTSLSVFDDVNGDVATSLDADGTLSDGASPNDGTALLDGNIKGLVIMGSVNKIFAGHDITDVTVQDAGEIRTGTQAGGQTIDFDGAGGGAITLLAFTPGDGETGGAITNVLISAGTGPLTLAIGDGGDSAKSRGGDAGKLDEIDITNDGTVNVLGGSGGDAFKKGGVGTQFSDFTIHTDQGGFAAGNNIVMDAGSGGSIVDLDGAKGGGGDAGNFLRGELSSTGDVTINASGGHGGDATKQAGDGSSLEQVSVTAAGAITLFATDGGSTPDTSHLDGIKGRGGVGGHISGKLKFGSAAADLTAAGAVSVFCGDGGAGGRSGGNGGGVFGLAIDSGSTVTVEAGQGTDYDTSTGSEKGNGGSGGALNSILVSAGADVLLTAGHGGGGSTTGKDGGNIGFAQITHASNVTFTAGDGGGFTDPLAVKKENTDTGGKGGSIMNNRVGGLPGDSITGDVVFTAGNGYGNSLDIHTGGAGGELLDSVIAIDGNITLVAGQGGEADDDQPDNPNVSNTVGGAGGSIDTIEMNATNITIIAGPGGHGVNGGRGGLVLDLDVTVAGEVNVTAGAGGSATDRNGGLGGDVTKVDISGTGFARAIVAGDGGVPSDLIKGRAGDGGSIQRITFIGGTLGDFDSAASYGIVGMGGLFAGDGRTAGDVTDVIAGMISNIVAHDALDPTLAKAAGSISNIVATAGSEAIGSDKDDDGKFDFSDANTNGLFDPASDAPIDGLVLAASLGNITGTTLFTLETGTGISTGMIEPN